MKTFKNLKLLLKFLITFGIILVLVLILGISSIKALSYANSEYSYSIKVNNKIIKTSMDLTNSLSQMRLITSAIGYGNTINEQQKKDLKMNYDNILQLSKDYSSELENKKNEKDKLQSQELMSTILDGINDYYSLLDPLISSIENKDDAKRKEILEKLVILGKDFLANAYKLPEITFLNFEDEASYVKNSVQKVQLVVILIFLFIVILGCTFGIMLSRIIRKPIESLRDSALQISKGNLDINVSTNRKDEVGQLSNALNDMSGKINNIILDINELIFQLDKGNINYKINSDKYEGAFKEVTSSINIAVSKLVNESLYIINTIKEFGQGNFEFYVKDFPGDKAIIKEEIVSIQTYLKNLSYDINNIIETANNGNLKFRLDTSKYIGQWKEITDGLNRFVENVVIPIEETQNALKQFSIGNFSHRITNEYKGEFNNIKQTVNYTAETVGSYISEISYALNQMANKNFDLSINRDYLGDFEQIRNSLNLIITNLNLLTKDIIESAEKVSFGSKQISQSSVSLADGATKQAEAVEELNSTINIISRQSSDNVQNTEKANSLALQAKDSANKGTFQMDSMLIAMQEINNASNSISNIIKVIDDIAFQTNILALNAAVEAARAGEHGKGFAVVSEEVRNLAARSQQAAKETTDLIKSSIEKVTEGSKIANDTAESLLYIAGQIDEIATLINASTISSKEQEKSIEDFTGAISQISTVTQENTATSEETAASSEELANQAEIFYSSVSDFKLRD